jgi:hypothetical protein
MQRGKPASWGSNASRGPADEPGPGGGRQHVIAVRREHVDLLLRRQHRSRRAPSPVGANCVRRIDRHALPHACWPVGSTQYAQLARSCSQASGVQVQSAWQVRRNTPQLSHGPPVLDRASLTLRCKIAVGGGACAGSACHANLRALGLDRTRCRGGGRAFTSAQLSSPVRHAEGVQAAPDREEGGEERGRSHRVRRW